jgi:hypothetical protein
MIRVIMLILLLPAFLFCSAQNNSLTDGPYLFYKKDYLLVESIVNGQIKKDSTAFNSGNLPQVSVAVPGQSNAFFTVPLKGVLEPEASTYRSGEKLFILSDVEGSFQAMNKLLLAGSVIDNSFKWIFGKGHLVMCGDFLTEARK